MNEKLIFLDIDGTLLIPGEMKIPESALDAIKRARANGHKVFLCTGRNYRMTSPLLELGCFDGYVCSAGGYVCCDGEVLVDIPMDKSQLDGLVKSLNEYGVECTIETKNDTYGGIQMIDRYAVILKNMEGVSNSEAERWVNAMKFGMTIRPLEEYNGDPVYKIVYIAPGEKSLLKAKSLYEDQFVFCQYYAGTDPNSIINGELINRKFDKGTGIKAVCKKLGKPLDDTIGFGDSENDLQMTDVVGISVCMANGSDSLKKHCDRICPAVTDDGIAKEFAALGLI